MVTFDEQDWSLSDERQHPLNHAVARRGGTVGYILLTDRGSQFRSRQFVHALGRYEMVGSMGRVGAADDNASMESFFSLLGKERPRPSPLGHQRGTTDRRSSPGSSTYHRRRRQAALGRLTPIELEAIMTTPAGQAA